MEVISLEQYLWTQDLINIQYLKQKIRFEESSIMKKLQAVDFTLEVWRWKYFFSGYLFLFCMSQIMSSAQL